MAFGRLRASSGFVENRRAIDISKIYKKGLFDKPRVESSFLMDGLRLRLLHSPSHLDWYINLENYGPTCNMSAFNLAQTKCHFGGTREWLICPACNRKVGVLYEEKDDFKCRQCVGLIYFTSTMNYRSLQPAINNTHKLEKIDYFSIRPSYKGKITRRMARYEKLRESSIAGWHFYGQKIIQAAKDD